MARGKGSATRCRRRSRGARAATLLLVTVGLLALPNAADATSTLRVGVTHTQYSLDSGDAAALASARALLSAHQGMYQNQHIMGFGALNPWPSQNGPFNWGSLDGRIELIRDTGGTPVITLCCAPDWMKGGTDGQTNWQNLEAAPYPEYFDEFAELATAVAERYPDVLHFQVWNEMKGFWMAPPDNRWDFEGYTDLYNQVYIALKDVNPAIQVGGPYVHMSHNPPNTPGYPGSVVSGAWGTVDQRDLDVIEHWLDNAIGADFITIDGTTESRNDGYLTSVSASAQKFAAINDWIRDRTDLPIWWAELYPYTYGTSLNYPNSTEASLWENALEVLEAADTAVVLYWQPEASTIALGLATHIGIWTKPTSGGGQRTAVYNAIEPWLG